MAKKIKVYFEIFGKKMVTEVEADNQDYAKAAVKNKIIFHKFEEVKEQKSPPSNPMDLFNDIFKGFGK